MGFIINPYQFSVASTSNWLNKRSITIDHTKVSNTDKANFPFEVNGTYSYLATTANGGSVLNSNGYDIAFFSDLALTTQLKHEVERYVATTGEVIYWVKVPNVSTTVDTVIYIAYANSTISTSQADAPNSFTNYAAVYHLGDGTTLSAVSSINSANNGTTVGSPTAGAGQIGGGGVFNGSTQGIQASLTLSGTNKITVSFWLYVNTNASNDALAFEYSPNYNSNNGGFIIDPNNASPSGTFNVGMHDSTGGYSTWAIPQRTAAGWHYYSIIFDRSSSINGVQIYICVDGVKVTATTSATNPMTGNFGDYTLNMMCRNGANLWLAGKLDEVRIATVVHDLDWHITEYNNQNSPSTFYTISSPL